MGYIPPPDKGFKHLDLDMEPRFSFKSFLYALFVGLSVGVCSAGLMYSLVRWF